MSAILFALSLIPTGLSPFWGVYVGRRYRKWELSVETGLAIACLPPFLISITLSVASVLCK